MSYLEKLGDLIEQGSVLVSIRTPGDSVASVSADVQRFLLDYDDGDGLCIDSLLIADQSFLLQSSFVPYHIVTKSKRGLEEAPVEIEPAGPGGPIVHLIKSFFTSESHVLIITRPELFSVDKNLYALLYNGLDILRGQGKYIITVGNEHFLQDDLNITRIVDWLESDPPSLEQLIERTSTTLSTNNVVLDKGRIERLAKAGIGLTLNEFEDALARTLHPMLKYGTELDETILWSRKAELLNRNTALKMNRSKARFENIGGLEGLKQYAKDLVIESTKHGIPAKGILILGVPGCGKSLFCTALGNETNRPTFTLDVGSLFGPLVGQSEQQLRSALASVDVMAPNIVHLDEVEKALAGLGSSGQTDSGVTARVFGSLLTWMNDRKSDSFVVATCNDISNLPPPFLRAERWDAIFYIGLPSKKQREQIWRIHLDANSIDDPIPESSDWTGAEISQCCRHANVMRDKGWTLEDAAERICPIARAMGSGIKQLEKIAMERCLDAETGYPFGLSVEKNNARKIRGR